MNTFTPKHFIPLNNNVYMFSGDGVEFTFRVVAFSSNGIVLDDCVTYVNDAKAEHFDLADVFSTLEAAGWYLDLNILVGSLATYVNISEVSEMAGQGKVENFGFKFSFEDEVEILDVSALGDEAVSAIQARGVVTAAKITLKVDGPPEVTYVVDVKGSEVSVREDNLRRIEVENVRAFVS